LESVAWDPRALSEFSAALILTDHDEVDYRTVVQEVPLVVDTRNVTAEFVPLPDNVLKA
jgi:UDP-N-acetyl-D-glucosamine dehydrogenase